MATLKSVYDSNNVFIQHDNGMTMNAGSVASAKLNFPALATAIDKALEVDNITTTCPGSVINFQIDMTSPKQPVLSWQYATSKQTKIQLQKDADGKGFVVLASFDINTTKYVDGPQDPTITYKYQIYAEDADGNKTTSYIQSTNPDPTIAAGTSIKPG